MFFEMMFDFLLYYLAFLALIALMGMRFSRKYKELKNTQTPQKSLFKGLYKHCPCRKAVENGLMSNICIYSSIAACMLSISDIALTKDYSLTKIIVLLLSAICAWFGWILKKE